MSGPKGRLESRFGKLVQWSFDLAFHKRALMVIPLHVAIFVVSYVVAFGLRFGRPAPWEFVFRTLPVVVLLQVLAFAFLRIFHGLFRYTSYVDIINIMKGAFIGSAAVMLYSSVAVRPRIPPTVIIIDFLLVLTLCVGVRMLLRYMRLSIYPLPEKKRALVVGGLYECQYVVNHLQDNKYAAYHPVVCLDVHANRQKFVVHGVPVEGDSSTINKLFAKYHVEVALVSSEIRFSSLMNFLAEECARTAIPVKLLPQQVEFFDNSYNIHDVNIDDLIERGFVTLNEDKIRSYLIHRRVLVTGAGGSIGRELSLRLAKYDPELIVLLDRFENNLHHVSTSLREHHPHQRIKPVLGTINDFEGIQKLLKETNIQVVFHCAAHKHVPILEVNPLEAGYNNIMGTKNVAVAAHVAQVAKFVMVSTDKAVEPTSVMGASKRMAELFVQALDGESSTQYITIRFGNVLNSDGSVVPLFREQIRRGGPVTVTHPEIERFFMSIPEACQLVLQAAAIGQGGEIFVLNMGKQVKILEIAEKMIVLAGKTPYKEVPIQITGLRQGEKFSEKLFDLDEIPTPTESEQIFVADCNPLNYTWLAEKIRDVEQHVFHKDVAGFVRCLRSVVPNCTCGEHFLSSELRHDKTEMTDGATERG
jgi:FlaA1/EpsC-like NDP-sugar epimerase